MKQTIWKTISIGGRTKKQVIADLKTSGTTVSSYAEELLAKTEFSKKSRDIELVKCTVQELGFTESPTTRELSAKVREIGSLLPAEVGPALRLAYPDQPLYKWYYLMMEPITGSGGDPNVFGVVRDGRDSWLYAGVANPDDRWDLGVVVVFGARKPLEPASPSLEVPKTLALESAIKFVKDAGYKIYKEI